MLQYKQLEEWKDIVSLRFPHMSKPQAAVLAMWSFGMVIVGSCGLTTVSAFLAELLGLKENSLRQRFKEWYKDAKKKKGVKRQEIDVRSCFPWLLRWVISWWPSDEKRMAIALDATTLADRFTILAISVVFRGCAIPIAWVILRGHEKGSWQPHWIDLLNQLNGIIPSDWTVIVMADRGLYAKWLYTAIKKIGWHPFLRINRQGTYRPSRDGYFRPLKTVILIPGTTWAGEVVCFKSNPLKCTLLACWEEGYDEPWLIVTDLTPEQANVCWYGLRCWIECGFKDIKRGGWQWQNTKITDPARAERFWLVISVATLWVVSVGAQAETNLPASGFEQLPPTHIARRHGRTVSPVAASKPRLLSCFRRGMVVILAALLKGETLPKANLCAFAWPTTLPKTILRKKKTKKATPLKLAA